MTTLSERVLTGTLQMIPLEQLEASRNNPRRTMNEGDLQELAASIREHGIQVPLLVRSISDDTEPEAVPCYEIVCGHRRSESATIASLTEVPCIVREMSDEEAAEIALIDNLQRVDVPPLEEAEAFGELLDRLHSIAAVASKVGKEQSYIAKQLKLRTLTEASRTALTEQLITVDHARLLCRLADDEQNDALKWCLDHNAGTKKPVDKVIAEILARRTERAAALAEDPEEYSYFRGYAFEPQSVVRLKHRMEEDSGTPLDRAPWPLDETHLDPDAGSCLDCPKNTKANVPLFGDLEIGEPKCTDGACFREKTSAFVRIQSRLSDGVQAPLRVSFKLTSTAPRMEKDGSGPNPAQIFKASQWIEAKKKCEHTRPAVTVDWSDANNRGYVGREDKLRKPGQILQVCVAQKCKTHPKDYEKPKSSADGHRDPAAEKAQEEKRKAAAIAENKLRMAVAASALEDVTSLPADALRKLAIAAAPNWGDDLEIAAALMPGFKKTLQTAKVDSIEFVKAAALSVLDELSASEYAEPKQGRDQFLASVKLLGWKGPDPWAPAKTPAKPAEKKAPVKTAAKPAKKTATKKSAAKKPAKKAVKKGGRK